MKHSGILCYLFCATILCACGNGGGKKEVSIPLVRVDTVRQSGTVASMEFPGRVVSAEEANLAFKVSGTISKVYVREGDYIKAGQLVAELDDKDYKVQLSATEAEYALVKAEAERVMALYEEGATTASNYDKARYGLSQMEAKLQNHRNQVAYCRLYAPYSGRVKIMFMDSREIVGAGMPVMGIVGDGVPEILVNLPAVAYLQRSSFVSYEAAFNVLPGETVPLDFVSVMGEANTNQLYTLRLRLSSANPQIAPGMSAWVTVKIGNQNTGVVSVPSTSIVEDNGGSYVFVYDPATQKVSRQRVEVYKLHTDGSAEVTGIGNSNVLVVSSGVHFISEGDKVEVLAPISSTNVGGLL